MGGGGFQLDMNSGCYGNLRILSIDGMGKVEIDNFSVSTGIFVNFTEMFIEQSSTFHMNFVQITEFDWLLG